MNPGSKEWEYLRHQLYFREYGNCQNCGQHFDSWKAGFQIHHIVPQARGGTDDLRNLALLCVECHGLTSVRAKETHPFAPYCPDHETVQMLPSYRDTGCWYCPHKSDSGQWCQRLVKMSPEDAFLVGRAIAYDKNKV